MLRRGHELGSKEPGWSYPSPQWVAQAERLAVLAPRLQGLLKGEERPRDLVELLAVTQMCYDKKYYVAGVRFWGESLKVDPKLGESRQPEHRYNAACAAILAASGQAKDDPPPDDDAKAKLRGQARDWLKAELVAWAKVLDAGPARMKAKVLWTLQDWKLDADLAAIRDPEALAKLPEAERLAWQALWAEVDALLKRAQAEAR
jgi:hypothetical protein